MQSSRMLPCIAPAFNVIADDSVHLLSHDLVEA